METGSFNAMTSEIRTPVRWVRRTVNAQRSLQSYASRVLCFLPAVSSEAV